MTPALQQFLAARFPTPGLWAWSIRLPDASVASQSYSQWARPAETQQVLARLSSAADRFQSQRIEPRRLCWIFSQLRLYLAVSCGGARLALIVQNQREPALAAEKALDDFLQLAA